MRFSITRLIGILAFLLVTFSLVVAQTSVPQKAEVVIQTNDKPAVNVKGPGSTFVAPDKFNTWEKIQLEEKVPVDMVKVLAEVQGRYRGMERTAGYFAGGLVCESGTVVRLSPDRWESANRFNGKLWGVISTPDNSSNITVVFANDNFKRKSFNGSSATNSTINRPVETSSSENRIPLGIEFSGVQDQHTTRQFVVEMIEKGYFNNGDKHFLDTYRIVADNREAELMLKISVKLGKRQSWTDFRYDKIINNVTVEVVDEYGKKGARYRRGGVSSVLDKYREKSKRIAIQKETSNSKEFDLTVNMDLIDKKDVDIRNRVISNWTKTSIFTIEAYKNFHGKGSIRQKAGPSLTQLSNFESVTIVDPTFSDLGVQDRRFVEFCAILNLNLNRGIF